MRVYHIAGGYDGCFYVRCMLPLIQNGWWGAKTSIRMRPESKEQMLRGAMASDIVVFQRPMQKEHFEAAKLLKEAGKKIVMDNDDTYKANGGLPKVMAYMLERQIDEQMVNIDKRLMEFAEMADLVTVTVPFLAKEYLPHNPNTIVLPNCVDPDDWAKIPKRNDGEKVRIGLVGSVAMNNDTKYLTPILRKLGRRDDVQLVVFAMPPKDTGKEVRKFFQHEIAFWNTMNIEWQPSVELEDYFDTLNNLKLDMMLIPRDDNYFNRCKSNVKFLEASMCEIPVIAQGFEDGLSPYQQDAEALKLVYTLEQWEATIDELIADKDKRRELGRKAKDYVLKNYNIKDKYTLWRDAYKKLL